MLCSSFLKEFFHTLKWIYLCSPLPYSLPSGSSANLTARARVVDCVGWGDTSDVFADACCFLFSDDTGSEGDWRAA